MYIVMTSPAQNKSSWKWQHPRRNVALVEVDPVYYHVHGAPKMISARARGVISIVRYWEALYVGSERSEYHRTLAEAEAQAAEHNRGKGNAVKKK